jgi:hypothetical protein
MPGYKPAISGTVKFDNLTYTSTPISNVASPTGGTLGPLSIGKWEISSDIDCYWLRGDSALEVANVKVDESTPDLSHKIFGGVSKVIYVEAGDVGSNDYLAFKAPSGGQTGPVVVSKQAT